MIVIAGGLVFVLTQKQETPSTPPSSTSPTATPPIPPPASGPEYASPESAPQTQTPPQPPYSTPYSTPPPPAEPESKNFTIEADDSSATPASISVGRGTKVNLTFQVKTTGVYFGGLDFRSSAVNTGTILPGESKTITFTANESFALTPYWPASNTAKGYTEAI